MKAIVYDFSLFKFLALTVGGRLSKRVFWSPLSPVSLKNIPEPTLPNEDWVIVKTVMSGFCASDMSAIMMADSPTMTPFASFPFVLGHENVGVISQVGENVSGFSIGDRVAVNPGLSCEARGMTEMCPTCRRGDSSACENMAEGVVAKGVNTGYSTETGGGWSPYFRAHASQLFKLDGVSDEEGVMLDPFCSSLHPVMQHFPEDDDTVLIIGAGPLGLSAVQALRGLGSTSRIIVMEKSPPAARRAMDAGADRVITSEEGGRTVYDIIGEITNAKVYKPIMGDKILMGGVNIVYDTVGHAKTMGMSLRLLATGGVYVCIGLAAVEKLDLTPLWLKKLTIAGSLGYGIETYNGKEAKTWDVALDLVRNRKVDLGRYVTHRFRLDEYKEAIRVNAFKERYKAVKTVFVFD
ncbi:MAG: alcohol dehydrogenase catalytic domain-containing protein [Deltaproteobacteria bacterium]|nr:alcohol dehydrogenase catalytic domain-containing protein [Candidatus Zymogenaceae bacterium]